MTNKTQGFRLIPNLRQVADTFLTGVGLFDAVPKNTISIFFNFFMNEFFFNYFYSKKKI